jgi:hypothetical protein
LPIGELETPKNAEEARFRKLLLASLRKQQEEFESRLKEIEDNYAGQTPRSDFSVPSPVSSFVASSSVVMDPNSPLLSAFHRNEDLLAPLPALSSTETSSSSSSAQRRCTDRTMDSLERG